MGTVIMYDDVTVGLLPPGADAYAAYADGRYENFEEVKKRFPKAFILKIDVRGYYHNGDVLDVESGDATNAEAVGWFKARKGKTQLTRPMLYTSASNVHNLIETLKKAGIRRSQYFIWSAHYSGTKHICAPSVCGYPAADGTQWTSHSHGRSLDESLMNEEVFAKKVVTPAPKVSLIRLEMCPLHTEKPEWAAHAPEQVAAACKRKSLVIGLSEMHAPVTAKIAVVAKEHGYTWFGDRDTAMLVRGDIKVLEHKRVVVSGRRGYSYVRFELNGRQVTVFNQHWETDTPDHAATRNAQTKALIVAMNEASKGTAVSFYMGDCNPTKPQSKPGAEPVTELRAAGLPSIYQELKRYPLHIGATVIGRNKDDVRVKAIYVRTFPALGSDHIPAVAIYEIGRAA